MNTLTIIVFILKGVGHLLSMIRNTRLIILQWLFVVFNETTKNKTLLVLIMQ